MALPIPDQGIVFAPVGCGDSITVAVNADTIVQVDIHHVGDAEDEDDSRLAIVDELIDVLPERNGKPYLAAFGATHLDDDGALPAQDHHDKGQRMRSHAAGATSRRLGCRRSARAVPGKRSAAPVSQEHGHCPGFDRLASMSL
jgi:hypothetical protein